MTYINQSASKVGTIETTSEWAVRVTFWLGFNRNTGDDILWVAIGGHRARRYTGRNLVKEVRDLDEALTEGECRWVGEPNDAALNHMRKHLEATR